MRSTKRKFPTYIIGKAKQFTLWDQEQKISETTPGPVSYNQDDSAIKMQRFRAISLGKSKKVTNFVIPMAPGPADYDP